MKKFVVTYHAPADAMAQMADSTPEEMAAGMEEWNKWATKIGSGLVDMGTPLMGGQMLNTDGSSTNSSREVCGYSILQAENMDSAKELLQGHPHLGWTGGCSIEVHEAMPLPGEN